MINLTRRNLARGLVGLFSVLCVPVNAHAFGRASMDKLNVAGAEREYILHVPAAAERGGNVPLVLVFHGGHQNARKIQRITGFDEVADRAGFIVAYPDGIDGHWNDGRETTARGPDDLAFVAALIDSISTRYPVDITRVYAVGASNGGLMVHNLACHMSDRFAALAAVLATMPAALSTHCRPPAPVPLMLLLGTDDPIVPWAGGEIKSDVGGRVLSALATRDLWADLLGCSQPSTHMLPDLAPDDDTRVQETVYRCRGRGALVFTAVEGGGHAWPGYRIGRLIQRAIGHETLDIDGASYVWRFFENKRLDTLPAPEITPLGGPS
jgi:polyhydroxybutyrate depolymerase